MVDILRKIGTWFNSSADKLSTVDNTLNDRKKYIFIAGVIVGFVLAGVLK